MVLKMVTRKKGGVHTHTALCHKKHQKQQLHMGMHPPKPHGPRTSEGADWGCMTVQTAKKWEQVTPMEGLVSMPCIDCLQVVLKTPKPNTSIYWNLSQDLFPHVCSTSSCVTLPPVGPCLFLWKNMIHAAASSLALINKQTAGRKPRDITYSWGTCRITTERENIFLTASTLFKGLKLTWKSVLQNVKRRTICQILILYGSNSFFDR